MRRFTAFLPIVLISTTILTGVSCQQNQNNSGQWTLFSPNGNINVQLHLDQGKLFYKAFLLSDQDTISVLEKSPLGIICQDRQFEDNLSLVSIDSTKTLTEEYTLLTGKRLKNKVIYRESAFSLKNERGDVLDIVFRLYNDGYAFRYGIPSGEEKTVKVTSEISGFRFPSSGIKWMQPYDSATKWTPAYENYFVDAKPVGTASPMKGGWCFPALVKLPGAWVMLTESNLNGEYFGAHLVNKNSDALYTIQQPDSLESESVGNIDAVVQLPAKTPWRVALISSDLSGIIQSNLVFDVADPADIQRDFSWVQPGRSSWSWWGEPASSRDFIALKKYIDLSASMGWEYSLVDANWNQMHGGSLEELVSYAKEKGVGIWLWYNSGGSNNTVTEQPRDMMSDNAVREGEMRKLQQLGVKGIKVDFFQSDKQGMMQQYLDILRDAADYQIMVNFHGCTIPKGWSKQWQNLLTMESVKGAECYIFDKQFPDRAPLHNVHLAFTRNVIGSMDYTPVTFSNNKYPHITTNGHELALSIVYETGLLHFADRTTSYLALSKEIKELLRSVPTTWDETRFISGSPSSHIIIARRKGDNWFIAGINGTADEIAGTISLTFLTGAKTLQTFTDNANKSISSKSDKFSGEAPFTMLPYGGFAMVVSK